MKPLPDFLVRVNCITYNHSKYICDALDGFCMQQTKFPYICTIFDDASIDNEQNILESYLRKNFNLEEDKFKKEETKDFKLIVAQNINNSNCYFAIYFLKYNHHSIKKSKQIYADEWRNIKYYAICEGDDYWTSPQKLQLQVDFMESHPYHSLCFHAHYSLFHSGIKKEHIYHSKDVDDVPMEDMITGGGGFMATNSMFYLQKHMLNLPDWTKNKSVGDCTTMLTLAGRGKVGYINEIMSCYRVASEGSWTQRVLRDKKQSKEHYKRTQLVWKEYDKWTDFKYHKVIKKKILKNKIHFWTKRNIFIEKTARCVMKYAKRFVKK